MRERDSQDGDEEPSPGQALVDCCQGSPSHWKAEKAMDAPVW